MEEKNGAKMEGQNGENSEKKRDIRRYTCEYCGIVRSKKSIIILHIMANHKDKVVEAEAIAEEETGRDLIKKNVCEQCGVGFRKPAHLKQHMQSHSIEVQVYVRPFTCQVDDCCSSYRRKDHLNRHLLTHQGKLFRCPVKKCKSSFAFQGNMTRHVREMHEDSSSSSDVDAPKQYVCPEIGCGKVFKYPSKLRKHEDSHVKLDTVETVCSEPGCKKYFTNIHYLKDHITSCHIHFTCEICGTKQLKKNFKRHLRTHDDRTSLEKIKCSFDGCLLAFSNLSNLKQHIKAVHLEQRPFTCNIAGCGKRFSFKHVRDRHEKSGCHLFTTGDFVETDEQFRMRHRGGRKRRWPGIDIITRRRVSLPCDDSALIQGAEYISLQTSVRPENSV